MKNWIKRLTASLLLLGSLGAQAQEDYRFTLQEAQEYAVENGYVARQQKLEVDKKDQEVREVLGQGFPQISGSGEFQHFLDIPVQVIPDFISPVIQQNLLEYDLIDESDLAQQEPQYVAAQFGTEYNLTGSVEAQQLIFNGSYFVGLQAAKAVKELAKNNLDKTEADIRAMVAKAYHSALIAEKNVEVLRDNIANLEETVEETKALYENGFLEEQDLDQVKINLLNLKNSLNYSEQIAEISLKSLKFQMGLKLEDEITLTDDVESLVLMATDEGLADRDANFEEHPSIKLARSNMQIAQLNLKNEKTSYLPRLNAFFRYQEGAFRNEFNFFEGGGEWFPTTVWGLNLNVPIFSGFQRDARIQQGKIDLDKAQIGMEQTSEQLRMSIDRARTEFEFALQEFRNRTENLDLAERIRDRTRTKYEEGVASSTDLNVAEEQYLSAQNSYNQSALELLNKKVELDKALNKLQEQ